MGGFKINLDSFLGPKTDREKNICRELAYLHLKRLGARDMDNAAVREVVQMIHKNSKFRDSMRKIVDTPIEKICEALPNGNAGTRAKAFLREHGIGDVETLVRLRKADVTGEWGFGSETADALQHALKKNGLSFEMLLPKPLTATAAE